VGAGRALAFDSKPSTLLLSILLVGYKLLSESHTIIARDELTVCTIERGETRETDISRVSPVRLNRRDLFERISFSHPHPHRQPSSSKPRSTGAI